MTLRGIPGALGLCATFLAGCPGETGAEVVCGPNTKEENGKCVSTVEPAECADGSTLNPDTGQCEPDATCGPGTTLNPQTGECEPGVVCGENTTFNPDTGLCEPDIVCGEDTTFNPQTGTCDPNSVCGEGTFFDEDTGECVPEENCGTGTTYDPDTRQCVPDLVCGPGLVAVDSVCLSPLDLVIVEADALESETDANDPAFGGTPEAIALEAVGERTVFSGVISRPADRDDDGVEDQDVDFWRFTGSAGQLLNITVSSTGAFQPAFVVSGPNGYYRESQLGFSLDAQRQVVLPYDGEYDVVVVPSLVLQGVSPPVGDNDAVYAGVVEELTWPTPAALAVPDDGTQGTLPGNLLELTDNFFTISPSTDTPVVLEASAPESNTVPALVLLTAAGESIGEASFELSNGVYTAQAGAFVSAAEGIIAVLDWRASTGQDGTFELKAARIGNVDIGAVGEGADIETPRQVVTGLGGIAFSFDAVAGQVVMTDFDGISANVTLLSPSGVTVYSGEDPFYEATFYAHETGTYRWVVINTSGSDSPVSMAIRSYTPHVFGPVDGTTVQTTSFSGDELPIGRRPTGEWFLVENTGPALIEVEWDWRMGTPDMDVYALNANGFAVDRRSATNDDPYTMRRLAAEPGYTLARLDPGFSGATPNPWVRGWSVDLIARPPPSAAEAEPNDSVEGAQAITGEGLRLTGEIGDEEHDVFLYTLETPLQEGEGLRVQVEWWNVDFSQAELRIRAPGTTLDDDPLYTNDNFTPASEWILLPSDGAGPFVIDVLGDDSQGDRSEYVLAVDRVQLGAVEAEPNDTVATAQALGPVALDGFPLRVTGVSREGEPDVFALTLSEALPAGSALRIRADNLNEVNDLLVDVFDAGEVLLAESDHEDAFHLIPLSGTGPIYIQVQGDLTTNQEQYRVTIDVLSPVEVEPNDDVGTATLLGTLAPGGSAAMWGVDVENATDVFRVELDGALGEGEALSFRWYNNVGRGDIGGAVLDAAGNVIAFTEKYAGQIVVGEAGATGPYFLELTQERTTSDTYPEIYRVEVERIAGVVTEVEPNDDFAGANVLTLPATINALCYDQDDDVYVVTLTEDLVGGEKLILDGFVPNSMDDITVRVYPEGDEATVVELASITDVMPYLEVDLPVTTTGTRYFIVVEGSTSLLTNERDLYELSVSLGVP